MRSCAASILQNVVLPVPHGPSMANTAGPSMPQSVPANASTNSLRSSRSNLKGSFSGTSMPWGCIRTRSNTSSAALARSSPMLIQVPVGSQLIQVVHPPLRHLPPLLEASRPVVRSLSGSRPANSKLVVDRLPSPRPFCESDTTKGHGQNLPASRDMAGSSSRQRPTDQARTAWRHCPACL